MFHTPPENVAWTPPRAPEPDDGVASVQLQCDLPPELKQHVANFLAGLQEPKYDKPPSAQEISLLYQHFYSDFQAHTHRLLSMSSTDRSKATLVPLQSLDEIAARRRDRKSRMARERQMLELAEKAICTPVYHKISRIPVGADIAENDRIQSKQTCLRQMNISLANLGLDVDNSTLDRRVELARPQFHNLDHAQSPSEKLVHLSEAQKIIVTALTEGTSLTSADAILPAFIYSVIRLQAPNIYLNLKYIERFRCPNLMTGEEMYTLTNLQAVVGFLDTVTLQDIQLDAARLPRGTPCDLFDAPPISKPTATILTSSSTSVVTPSTSSSNNSSHSSSSSPVPPPAPARLSILHPTELAANAVNSADQSLKSLGTTFNTSYKFLVGRFARDQSTSLNTRPTSLEEARHVVGLTDSPPLAAASPNSVPAKSTTALLDKLVDLSGLKPLRPSTSLQNLSHISSALPAIQYKFLHADPESLRLGEVRELLAEYKKLVKFVQSAKHLIN